MMEILRGVKNALYPFGELDLLYYYSWVSESLQNFLKGKELATKIHLSEKVPKLLKRGSQLEPIFIPDLVRVDSTFLKLRVNHHLKDVRNKLSYKQIWLWEYFFPRKMMDLLYACNREHSGLPIDRIFIDIDKGKSVASEAAQEATYSLLQIIKQDDVFNKLVTYRPVVLWTGNSFHIYLLLKKEQRPDFYERYLSYNRDKSESMHLQHDENFTVYRWADLVSERTGIKVEAGHEKTEDHLILDTSGTPSGKLARAPFSLHVSAPGAYDGIAVPVSEQQLKKRNLVKELKKLTPEKVMRNLPSYAKLL